MPATQLRTRRPSAAPLTYTLGRTMLNQAFHHLRKPLSACLLLCINIADALAEKGLLAQTLGPLAGQYSFVSCDDGPGGTGDCGGDYVLLRDGTAGILIEHTTCEGGCGSYVESISDITFDAATKSLSFTMNMALEGSRKTYFSGRFSKNKLIGAYRFLEGGKIYPLEGVPVEFRRCTSTKKKVGGLYCPGY